MKAAKEKACSRLQSENTLVLGRINEKSSSDKSQLDFDCDCIDRLFLDYSKDLKEFQSAAEKVEKEVGKKFAPKKNRSGLLSETYADLDMYRRAGRVSDCGSFLQFVLTAEGGKLHQANFCRDRLCPMCNWRRSMKIFGQVSQVMDSIESEYEFLFLTLTVRNCAPELFPDTVDILFKGWRYLYNKCPDFKRAVLGTFRTFETTINPKTGEYHPHLHTILAVRKSYFKKGYISQKRWTALWREACCLDYDPIVDIRKISPERSEADEEGVVSLAGAVAEVAKYAVKDTDFLTGSRVYRAEKVQTLLAGLTQRRLVGWTGCFAKARKLLNLDDTETGDLIHTDGEQELREDVKKAIVSYGWKSGAYVKL